MTLYLACSSRDKNYEGEIFALNLLVQLELEEKGIPSNCLMSDFLDVFCRDERLSLDEALYDEAAMSNKLRWAPLAYLQVTYRYFHYLQYKRRLKKIFDQKNYSKVILSSSVDGELIKALENLAAVYSYELEIREGEFVFHVGPHPVLNGVDIDDSISFDPSIFIRLREFFKPRKKILYQGYHNLPVETSNAVSFYQREFAFLYYLVKFLKRKLGLKTTSAINNFNYSHFTKDNQVEFKSDKWKMFEKQDLDVIWQGIENFQSLVSNTFLDQLYEKIKLTLSLKKPEEMVLMDHTMPFSRMLAAVCHDLNIKVSYLPHGVVFENALSWTGKRFHPDMVNAWNDSSKTEFEKYGLASHVVNHPLVKELEKSEKLKEKYGEIHNALVLLGTADEFNPHLYEMNLLEMMEAFSQVSGVKPVYKFHHAGGDILQNLMSCVRRIEKQRNVTLKFLDSSVRPMDIFKDYDLVIISGATTGLVEAACMGTRFLAYRPNREICGCLKDHQFPSVENVKELVEFLKNPPAQNSGNLKKFIGSFLEGKELFN